MDPAEASNIFSEIPEVCVYFSTRLLRGVRSSKVDTGLLRAFDSPNSEPLAEL